MSDTVGLTATLALIIGALGAAAGVAMLLGRLFARAFGHRWTARRKEGR